jgi:2'-phosphotransferase
VELKKGETIMTDASLHLPAACLHEAFSNRSGVPPGHFELYYLGKRLESEVALASWGVGKNATIEVKMRGRGGGCVRSKEASAAADRSAEQHPAGELDRFTADKAAAEEMVAEETVAERAIEEETVVEQAAVVKTSAEKPLSEKATVETAAVEKAAAEATLFVATAGVESETALSTGGIEKDDKKGEQPKVKERVPPSSSKAHIDKKLQDAQDAGVEEIKAKNFKEPGGNGVGVGGVEGGGVKIKLRGRGGADASGALEPAVEQAVVKIQALMRGNLARANYKDIRDEEARRQWLKYYVLTGNYAEAHKLGWDDGDVGEPGERLDGELAPVSWRFVKESNIEVKIRGLGGADATTGGGDDGGGTAAVGGGVGVEAETAGAGSGGIGSAGAGGVVEAATSITLSDAVIPPAHDVDLSKLLSKLLRHKAVELQVAIDADGWVALSDALAQINGPRLRELVGNAEKLGSREFTEADVREVVGANDKRRFVIDGTEIRAAQGHGMPGIGEKQGEPLTLETAPEVAVHGSYVEHVQAILEQGLSRMGRHHVHLAKGLFGEKGVISGMRPNAEVFVWVNVHEAIKGGLTFYESANGVILCGGRDGDGIIPPAFFSFVVELHGRFALETAQVSFARRALLL